SWSLCKAEVRHGEADHPATFVSAAPSRATRFRAYEGTSPSSSGSVASGPSEKEPGHALAVDDLRDASDARDRARWPARAAQAMLSCPGMAQAGQPLTVEVTIAVGTTPLCRVCWPDHPGECGQQIQSGGKPHRSGRDELGEAGAEPPQEGQADPQAGRGEGDPGDEGQDAEALFRLRGGAQGCRQWRPGGARSVDQTGS